MVVNVLETFSQEAPTQLHTPAACALRELLYDAHDRLKRFSRSKSTLQKLNARAMEAERVRIV